MRAITCVAPLVGEHLGDDRRAAGRQLVDGADVQVGVVAHRQRARDGRGAHHQQVGLQLAGRRGFLQLGAQRQALRHAEAVLLVDDGQAQAGEVPRRPGSPRACRPPAPPRHWPPRHHRLRPLPLRLPVSQATCARPSGSSHCTSLRKCCSARISVGAISAHCQPASDGHAAASAATTVLPEPTSPCSRRCMGCGGPGRRPDLGDHALLGGGQLQTAVRPAAGTQAAGRGRAAAGARQRWRSRLGSQPATVAGPAAPRTSAAARPGGCGLPAWPVARPGAGGAGTAAPRAAWAGPGGTVPGGSSSASGARASAEATALRR
jgi:hypothetical protein